jgi:hypothetical protein
MDLMTSSTRIEGVDIQGLARIVDILKSHGQHELAIAQIEIIYYFLHPDTEADELHLRIPDPPVLIA